MKQCGFYQRIPFEKYLLDILQTNFIQHNAIDNVVCTLSKFSPLSYVTNYPEEMQLSVVLSSGILQMASGLHHPEFRQSGFCK